jgi:hypothetical protein
LVSSPVTIDPVKTPTPVTALFTPRYFPSNPWGMLLQKITELEVLKIEKPMTIRHDEIIAIRGPIFSIIKGIETPGITTARTLGANATMVARSSPIFEIIFGATKKTSSIVAV